MLEVRAHLGTCNACREELDALRLLKRLLGAAPAPAPPAGFEQRLAASLTRPEPISARPAFGFPVAMFAGVAACSMFLMLGLLRVVGGSAPPANVVSRPLPRPSSPVATPVALEVQRDQMLHVGSDPMLGAPVVTAFHGER